MTQIDLEWHLVYALVVAGKSAEFANAAVKRLRATVPDGETPIEFLAVRPDRLEFARTGRYEILGDALMGLARINIDLRRCTPELLETIRGIGPKTSRFFIAWTRPKARVAVLDRHVLRWLKARGYAGVPERTPSGRTYAHWEGVFLLEADRRGKTPRELDLEIWGAAATAPNIVSGG